MLVCACVRACVCLTLCARAGSGVLELAQLAQEFTEQSVTLIANGMCYHSSSAVSGHACLYLSSCLPLLIVWC